MVTLRQKLAGHPTQNLIDTIAVVAKKISHSINSAAVINGLGPSLTKNSYGETQHVSDIIANNLLVEALLGSGEVCTVASEELKEVRTASKGRFAVCLDPLDGSSNLDYDVSVGTIFSIYNNISGGPGHVSDVLQGGKQQIAAGYFIYGPFTILILTVGRGVDYYILDQSIGEFILVRSNVRMPEKPTVYSINESYLAHWHTRTLWYVLGAKKRGLCARWVGSLVSDFHRNLLKGGIFLYPQDKKRRKGKLRLLYEANPLAFIVEQAGGAASDGSRNIMDIYPQDLHQRVPLVIGDRGEVEYYLSQR
jgi:fructose-1,6-bisphosphatase I